MTPVQALGRALRTLEKCALVALRSEWTASCAAALVLQSAALASEAGPSTHPLPLRDRPVWHTVGIWRQPQGLPQNHVRAILQTGDGYLWLGTSSGISRFDGVRFTNFDDRDRNQLRGGEVWAFVEGDDSSLWIGTYGGGVSRLKEGRFTVYTTKEGLVNDFVSALCRDPEGGIWIGTDGGLSRLKDGGFTSYTEKDGLTENKVKALHADRDGSVWIGGFEGGLSRFKDGKFEEVKLPGPSPDSEVRSFCRDREGGLWIGTFNGLWRLKDGTSTRYTTRDGLSSASVHQLHEDPEGNLWIATNNGLDRYAGGTFSRYRIEDSIPRGQQLTAIISDREGSLWVGTQSQGLAHLRRSQFVSYTSREGVAGDYVSSVLEDRRGRVWVGTHRGLSVIRDGEITTLASRSPLIGNVVSLAQDGRGDLLAGTKSGVYVLRYPSGCKGCEPEVRPLWKDVKLYARVIFVDREDAIWIGTDSDGLVRYKEERLTHYKTGDGLAGDEVRALCQDREGNLWIGTKNGGLSRFKDGRFTTLTEADGMASNYVQGLYLDGDGILWIATRQGLSRLKDGRFTTYTSSNGLYASFVFGFAEDHLGSLWMSCSKGIFRVSKRDLNDLADGRITSVSSMAYGVEHGLGGIVGTVGHHPGGARTRDGRVWFATTDGVAVADPAKVPPNKVPPTVHVEEVIVDQRPMDLEELGSLRPGRGDLAFRYTGLSFLAPEKVRFKYKLEGYDADFVDANVRNVAYYTNIPPGRYRFRVIACNADGTWNLEGAHVDLFLPPHFYQARWFYALVVLALSLVALGAHYARVRGLAAQQIRLETLVDERTRELRDATEKLDLANRDLERRVAQGIEALREAERMAAYGQMMAAVAHEVRHPVFALQAAAHVMRERLGQETALGSQLRTLESETHRLNVLMSDLLEFARPAEIRLALADVADLFAEAEEVFGSEGHAEVEVATEVEPGLPRVQVDRVHMVQALLNLMRNAACHAEGRTRITLSARRLSTNGGSGVRISIVDDGAGIPPDLLPRVFEPFVTSGKGTGLGLSVVRRVATAHGGDVSVESGPGRGTVFHLDLP